MNEHNDYLDKLRKLAIAETVVTETRRGYLEYLQNRLPDWPDYVIRDWVYPAAKGLNQSEMEALFDGIAKDYPVRRWELKTLDLDLNSFDLSTRNMILAREGGARDPMGVPRDAERHATQAQKIQQAGAPSQEPIIVIRRSGVDELELVEGWHRTIQNLRAFPKGYRARAWIGYT
jgi:hypothetical protein